MHDLSHLVEYLRRCRRYAGFFDWPDKAVKERGVVANLLRSLNDNGDNELSNPTIFQPDPPDVVCDTCDGRKVAIEVTEVVSAEAACRVAQGQSVYRLWGPGELFEHIDAAARKKDSKSFNGGPYSSYRLCFFTDEPDLSFEKARKELSEARIGPLEKISRVYLLFTYDPSTKGYPIIEIPIAL